MAFEAGLPNSNSHEKGGLVSRLLANGLGVGGQAAILEANDLFGGIACDDFQRALHELEASQPDVERAVIG